MGERGCFIVTVSVISKRRISSRNAYIRGEEKCRRSGWHRGCSFGAATARNIKSLPATTLNREIIQSVSRGFGHWRQAEGRKGAIPNPLFPSVTYSLSYSTVTQRGSFCFNPFANELSIKFYRATEIKEERGNEETSRFLNLYGRHCLTSSTLLVIVNPDNIAIRSTIEDSLVLEFDLRS